jgi:hypothetical protein
MDPPPPARGPSPPARGRIRSAAPRHRPALPRRGAGRSGCGQVPGRRSRRRGRGAGAGRQPPGRHRTIDRAAAPARPPAAWRASSGRARGPAGIPEAPSRPRPGGAVLDGRDIGTVIAPRGPGQALSSPPHPRCGPLRRWKQLTGRGADHRLSRTCWPTSSAATSATRAGERPRWFRPHDAVLLDTTDMDIESRLRCGPPYRRGGARPTRSSGLFRTNPTLPSSASAGALALSWPRVPTT